MTEIEQAKRIAQARLDLTRAEDAFRKIIRETYPVGSYIRWKEGPYIKAGNVTGYSLTGNNLRVAGKTVLISAITAATLAEDDMDYGRRRY